MSKNYVQIDPRDNLIVAITNLEEGTHISVAGQEIRLTEDIQGKHKFALNDFKIGDEIFMYGVLIGKAIQPITAGSAITMANVSRPDEVKPSLKQEEALKIAVETIDGAFKVPKVIE